MGKGASVGAGQSTHSGPGSDPTVNPVTGEPLNVTRWDFH